MPPKSSPPSKSERRRAKARAIGRRKASQALGTTSGNKTTEVANVEHNDAPLRRREALPTPACCQCQWVLPPRNERRSASPRLRVAWSGRTEALIERLNSSANYVNRLIDQLVVAGVTPAPPPALLAELFK